MKLREEMGVAYYVRSGVDTFSDHGYVEIAAGVTNARVQEVIGEILKECKKLAVIPVLDAELAKAKELLVGSMLLGLETSDSWANYLAAEAVYSFS
jgi:predicted Zn-dependent peptidase